MHWERSIAALVPLVLLANVAHAEIFIVNVGGKQPPTFSPQTVNIKVGDTVTFINKGGLHNVVADDGSFRCAHGCDGDGHGGSGAASSSTWVVNLTFTHAGKIGYFCEIHGAPGEGMFGTINVAGSPPPKSLQGAPAGGWQWGALLACVLALATVVVSRRRQ